MGSHLVVTVITSVNAKTLKKQEEDVNEYLRLKHITMLICHLEDYLSSYDRCGNGY